MVDLLLQPPDPVRSTQSQELAIERRRQFDSSSIAQKGICVTPLSHGHSNIIAESAEFPLPLPASMQLVDNETVSILSILLKVVNTDSFAVLQATIGTI